MRDIADFHWKIQTPKNLYQSDPNNPCGPLDPNELPPLNERYYMCGYCNSIAPITHFNLLDEHIKGIHSGMKLRIALWETQEYLKAVLKGDLDGLRNWVENEFEVLDSAGILLNFSHLAQQRHKKEYRVDMVEVPNLVPQEEVFVNEKERAEEFKIKIVDQTAISRVEKAIKASTSQSSSGSLKRSRRSTSYSSRFSFFESVEFLKPKQQHFCRKCVGHGCYVLRKGHLCPFVECSCENCATTSNLRLAWKSQGAIDRKTKNSYKHDLDFVPIGVLQKRQQKKLSKRLTKKPKSFKKSV